MDHPPLTAWIAFPVLRHHHEHPRATCAALALGAWLLAPEFAPLKKAPAALEVSSVAAMFTS